MTDCYVTHSPKPYKLESEADAKNPTSLDAIRIEHLGLSGDGVHLNAETLAEFGIAEDAQVTVMMYHGEVIITVNPRKQALIHSAEELQYRQDETKQDHSKSIASLVSAASSLLPSELALTLSK